MELKIEHLSKQFKDKTAVNDVNLQRRAGRQRRRVWRRSS